MYICFKLFKKSYIIQNDNLLNLTNETPNSMFIINRLSEVKFSYTGRTLHLF